MKRFIKIGSTRIKISNIKRYGIYTREISYSNGKSIDLFRTLFISDTDRYSFTHDKRTIKYLRIETFQNETFDFDEDYHAIYPTISELDAES